MLFTQFALTSHYGYKHCQQKLIPISSKSVLHTVQMLVQLQVNTGTKEETSGLNGTNEETEFQAIGIAVIA